MASSPLENALCLITAPH